MTEPRILDPRCELVAATTPDAQHYFGFHDVTPWSTHGDSLAILRVPLGLHATPSREDLAEVTLWKPLANERTVIASTRAFNWQQGSRLQWITDGRFLFNDLESDNPVSRIITPENSSTSTTVPAVYSVHPEGEFGLAPDWWRLSKWWRDYSYDLEAEESPSCGEPGDLRRVDLQTGEESVIIPIDEVRVICGEGSHASQSDFISHATFSPRGSRFCFMYRRFSEDGALFSFFLVANADGSDIRLLAKEKCSHFDWINEDSLVLWTRKIPTKAASLRSSGLTKRFPFKQAIWVLRRLNPKIKQSLFSEMYYHLDYNTPGVLTPVGAGVLEQDGHPMFTQDRKWMLTDTYAFEGHQPLILFEMATGQRTDVVSFPVHPDFRQPSLKCDLHPRLSRDDRFAAVDSAHSGKRQVYIVDISRITQSS